MSLIHKMQKQIDAGASVVKVQKNDADELAALEAASAKAIAALPVVDGKFKGVPIELLPDEPPAAKE